jgi:hypothetical protein
MVRELKASRWSDEVRAEDFGPGREGVDFEVAKRLAPQTGFALTPDWLAHTPDWRRVQRGLFFGFAQQTGLRRRSRKSRLLPGPEHPVNDRDNLVR